MGGLQQTDQNYDTFLQECDLIATLPEYNVNFHLRLWRDRNAINKTGFRIDLSFW
jgi:hypothetical protein